jgi:hypothetical protein
MFANTDMQHLEAALSITDEIRDSTTGFIIGRALDQLRADCWPGEFGFATAQMKMAAKLRRLSCVEPQPMPCGCTGDDVHWRDSYQRDGTVLSQSMGKNRAGTWRVENNQLCLDFGRDSGGCYEVWLAGSNVEFRRQGLDGSIMEGRLRKSSPVNQATKGRHQ